MGILKSQLDFQRHPTSFTFLSKTSQIKSKGSLQNIESSETPTRQYR